ncbi:MAG: hypothetical protein JRJ12_15370 [Deltaproteobacteria bacterium]|nr:hypothetical protein [Deltaproteobacteria bacterium]MBW2072356.1 hypothetical protein [Deltaproteobacteria bacterium]
MEAYVPVYRDHSTLKNGTIEATIVQQVNELMKYPHRSRESNFASSC